MLKFELSLEETNVILAALGKQAYEAVASVITKIQQQAAPQLAQPKNETGPDSVE